MQRPTATTVLLGATAIARGSAIGLVAPGAGVDPFTLVLLVEVLVPTAIAAADHRGHPAAPTAAVAHGALGAAVLMATGLAATAGRLAVTGGLVAFLVAASLATLAGGTAIGRWQDHGAPPAGPGPRWLRALALTAGAVVAVLLVTEDVAVLGTIRLDGGDLPGPVAVATTVSLRRLPLLVGALLPLAWAATRAGTSHLRAVALVLGAHALVEVVADAALLRLGGPVWPTAVAAGAALALLLAVPLLAQVTSSRV